MATLDRKDYTFLIINFQVYEVCLRQKLPGKLIHLFLHLSLMRIENFLVVYTCISHIQRMYAWGRT